MNDESIIELFFQRSDDAILELSKKYGKLSIQIAYNITRDYEDAEECVEDDYMTVWNQIPPERPDNLCAYVMKVLRNISINKYRHNRCVKRDDTYFECAEELEYCIAGDSVVEAEYEKMEIQEIIDEYIGSLSKVNRVIFLKRYWYMCSYEEIAELTGLNKKAVGSRLKRMRDNLKVILERKGYDYEG
jgi:RNA polymerase sigma-70 factor (ECF subfamily)